VAAYLPADGEVDLGPLLQQLYDRGAETLLPVIGTARSLRFATWTPDDVLAANRFGIPEPVAEGTVVAGDLDVVVLPCVAVDRRGGRLGFGAGYYDRALAVSRPRLVVGVAFEVQVADDVGVLPHDQPLDVVVTERGVVHPPR
jgi:5-formyltetrahydrofolate cyclo-ligase